MAKYTDVNEHGSDLLKGHAFTMSTCRFAASTFVLGPVVLNGQDFLTWFLVLTVAFWVVVAAVAAVNGKRR